MLFWKLKDLQDRWSTVRAGIPSELERIHVLLSSESEEQVRSTFELLLSFDESALCEILHLVGDQLRVREDLVGLETCPSSNVQTKAVDELREHPLIDFYQDNLAITINTDNRTVSNTTMTKEVEKVMEMFKLSMDDYKTIYRSSVEQSFASDEVKQHLLTFVESA